MGPIFLAGGSTMKTAVPNDPVPVTGELDLLRSDELEPMLLARAAATTSETLVLDCSELTFIDSSGLGMLVAVHDQTGKQLQLRNVSEACRRVFEVAGLDTMFEFA
jgi:anti-sigma B factor antagonist